MPKKPVLPDSYSIRLPKGFRDQIERAAEEKGQSPAEWIRDAIRSGLETQRRKMTAAIKRGSS